ncbi:MAG: hypothetical protein JW866_03485, partial [Ignavibacteriales bacterium]|nr:hypothetical protein [Ignavibacteriales bacterium]
MKTPEELQNLYDTRLVSELEAIEPMRKKLIRKIFIFWIPIIAFILGAVISGINQKTSGMIIFIIATVIT